MIYAVADLFLLSRNPGPMLRSKFSSFSDFANYYRKRAGRLMGKGFLVNGCADDGDLQEGVLTSATSASLGAERVYAGAILQKSVVSRDVVARLDMTVLGGAHRGRETGPESVKTFCESDVSVGVSSSLCAPSRLAACADGADEIACEGAARAFYGEVRDVFDGDTAASLGAKASRDAPLIIELNPLMRAEGAEGAAAETAGSATFSTLATRTPGKARAKRRGEALAWRIRTCVCGGHLFAGLGLCPRAAQCGRSRVLARIRSAVFSQRRLRVSRNRRTCDFSLTGCSFPWTTNFAVICFSRSRTPPGVPPPTPPP